jgi:tol-pal system protein YbgF
MASFVSFARGGLLAVALFSVAGAAHAQRQSLADRVAALERTAAGNASSAGQANVELLNRLTQVQGEVQALRNQVETLQNENAELRQSNQNRYTDLDTRLQRLEAGGAPAPVAGAASVPPASAPGGPGLVNRLPPPSDAAPAVAPAGDERAAYAAAFDALRGGDYVASARGFREFLRDYPNGALAPNAWYWLGESYYVTQNYPIALQSFDTLLRDFPGSAKAPDALLKRGFAQIELGDTGAGAATLNRVVNEYPGSDASRLATSRLRTLRLESR